MPHLTWPLQAQGPIVNLWVTISTVGAATLRKAGQAVPQGITLPALVDTGATGTVIDEATVQSLGLVETGFTHMHTTSAGNAAVRCYQYDAYWPSLTRRTSTLATYPSWPQTSPTTASGHSSAATCYPGACSCTTGRPRRSRWRSDTRWPRTVTRPCRGRHVQQTGMTGPDGGCAGSGPGPVRQRVASIRASTALATTSYDAAVKWPSAAKWLRSRVGTSSCVLR